MVNDSQDIITATIDYDSKFNELTNEYGPAKDVQINDTVYFIDDTGIVWSGQVTSFEKTITNDGTPVSTRYRINKSGVGRTKADHECYRTPKACLMDSIAASISVTLSEADQLACWYAPSQREGMFKLGDTVYFPDLATASTVCSGKIVGIYADAKLTPEHKSSASQNVYLVSTDEDTVMVGEKIIFATKNGCLVWLIKQQLLDNCNSVLQLVHQIEEDE